MTSSSALGLLGLGVLAGALITVQTVLNASLGARAGVLGSVLALTIVSFAVLIVLILVFPKSANFRELPGPSQWYLYLGGALGVIILVSSIFLGTENRGRRDLDGHRSRSIDLSHRRRSLWLTLRAEG